MPTAGFLLCILQGSLLVLFFYFVYLFLSSYERARLSVAGQSVIFLSFLAAYMFIEPYLDRQKTYIFFLDILLLGQRISEDSN